MAVDVHWLDEEQSILVFVYPSQFVIEEMIESQDTGLDYLEKSDGPIVSILDLSHVKTIPRQPLGRVPEMGRHPVHAHPNNAHTVVIIASPLLVRFAEVYKLYMNFRIVEDMEQAAELARERLAKGASPLDKPAD
ncbi:MAG: hypothetical protein GYB68_06210 [Chloroflexi bacterium]|nr:hypothetical protein [Chloroflexota bacterium]